MTKEQFFKTSTLVLLIINLLLVATIIWAPRPRPEGPKNYIIDRLQLNKSQIKAYETLIKKHRANKQQLHKAIKENKQQMFALLLLKNPSKIDSITAHIAAIHRKIELQDFDHFRALKKLCKPNQISNFEDLVSELGTLFTRKPPPPPRTK